MEQRLGDGIARQELHLIFVIDNSGSMSGQSISAVNTAIRDVMSIMPEIQEDTSDATIKLSALVFSDKAEWLSAEPQGVESFKWQDLHGDGETNLSAAYEKLSAHLKKRMNGGKMPDLGGVAPIILLMTDGVPTSSDWKSKLAELQKAGWFKAALKYALAIGVDSDEAMDVLKKFTGNAETVLKVYSAEALRRVIKVIAVTASKVKSQSSQVVIGGATGNELAKEEIAKGLEEIDEVQW